MFFVELTSEFAVRPNYYMGCLNEKFGCVYFRRVKNREDNTCYSPPKQPRAHKTLGVQQATTKMPTYVNYGIDKPPKQPAKRLAGETTVRVQEA
jgi:hypothetical protein